MGQHILTVPRALGGTLFITYATPGGGGGSSGALSEPTIVPIPRALGGTLFVLFTPQLGPNAPAPLLSPYTITQFFPQEMVLTPLPAPQGRALIGVGPGVGQPADTVGGPRN